MWLKWEWLKGECSSSSSTPRDQIKVFDLREAPPIVLEETESIHFQQHQHELVSPLTTQGIRMRIKSRHTHSQHHWKHESVLVSG